MSDNETEMARIKTETEKLPRLCALNINRQPKWKWNDLIAIELHNHTHTQTQIDGEAHA